MGRWRDREGAVIGATVLAAGLLAGCGDDSAVAVDGGADRALLLDRLYAVCREI